MTNKTVTVYVTYTIGGKLTRKFDANIPLADCLKAIEMQLEHEGLIEDAINFKCVHRELNVDFEDEVIS